MGGSIQIELSSQNTALYLIVGELSLPLSFNCGLLSMSLVKEKLVVTNPVGNLLLKLHLVGPHDTFVP